MDYVKKGLLSTTCLTVALLCAPQLAMANPIDGTVSAGQATIAASGTTLNITQQTDKAVIDWRGFDVGANETTAFHQPNSGSITLNRVNSASASQIDGTVTANGNIVILNSNGVMFGAGARVDVNGLIVSTADIDNNAFMNSTGTLAFNKPGNPTASIINNGTISAHDAGLIGLVAPNVINNGVITANVGRIQLASGDTATVDMYGDKLLEVAVSDQVKSQLISNTGTIQANGGKIMLTAAAGSSIVDSLISVEGELSAPSISQHNGEIVISGQTVNHTGTMDVSGVQGGKISITAQNISQQGDLLANGTDGAGGTIILNYSGHFIDSRRGRASAQGVDGNGGTISIVSDTSNSTAFLSGDYDVSAQNGQGGSIDVTAADSVSLFAAQLNANGDTGGGSIRIGGDYQGGNGLAHASDTQINFSSLITADALQNGDGGRIVMWGDNSVAFAGTATAKGGAVSGNGGLIELSSLGTQPAISTNATIDASSPHGAAGTLLYDPKNITIAIADSLTGLAGFEFVDPDLDGNGVYDSTTVLSNGNVVIAKPDDSFNGANAGAVYLFDGQTGALISTLLGSQRGDAVGLFGVTQLTNGNFVVDSPNWNGTGGILAPTLAQNGLGIGAQDPGNLQNVSNVYGAKNVGQSDAAYIASLLSTTALGAVTWGDATQGVSGIVNQKNSLVGKFTGDQVGVGGVTALTNGNYVVDSPNWKGGMGAVTWGDGSAGVTGLVVKTNSITGIIAGDEVGSAGVTALSDGNYVVLSPNWKGTFGAATWADGSAMTSENVNVTNSLIGNTVGDQVGDGGVVELTNGNYVVISPDWHSETGAVTWNDGANPTLGAVTKVNSLIGNAAGDKVGSGGVTALTNGNYVIASPEWTGETGAVTWGDGSVGTDGIVRKANSITGSKTGDMVGSDGIVALNNGDYVIDSSQWKGTVGAVTWGDGTVATSEVIAAGNSLIGSNTGDEVGSGGVVALTNGNYVVISSDWNKQTGAVTLAQADGSTTGVVGKGNSLIGAKAGDQVGSGGITVLSNDQYVVISPEWQQQLGAVTWQSDTKQVGAVVGKANSLIGSQLGDEVGSGGVVALTNGNYVVVSPEWQHEVGAVTWESGKKQVSAIIDSKNSIVGETPGDMIGSGGVFALSNGDYVIASPEWQSGSGAVTWMQGLKISQGIVDPANSLIGRPGDHIGNGGVLELSNGAYVVTSFSDKQEAILTLGSDKNGVRGGVSNLNSMMIHGIFGGDAGAETVTLTEQAGLDRFVVAFNDSTDGVTSHSYSVLDHNTPVNSYTFGYMDSGSDVTLNPNFITATLNNGTAVTLQASNDITVNDAITTVNGSDAGGALTLQAGRSIYLNADITTDNGNLTILANEGAAAGVIDADRDAGTAVIAMANGTTVNAGTGTVFMHLDNGAGNTNTDSGDISLANINAGSILVQNVANTGDIILNGTLTAATDLTLVSARNLINNEGADALTVTGGNWLVYTTSPDNNVLNGLSGDLHRYSCTYGGSCPAFGGGSNALLYSFTPVLTATPDAVALTYGDNAPTLSNYNYTLSGFIDSDASIDTISGSLSGTTNYSKGSGVGSYGITYNAGTLASELGYAVSYASDAAAITVNKAHLTVTADGGKSMVYGANALPTLTDTISGFVNGENATSAGVTGAAALSTDATAYNGTAQSGSNAGTYTIYAAASNLNAANYDFSYANAVGGLTVTKAQLTATADNQTRLYGQTNPTFSETITGFVNGDSSSIVTGSASGSSTANALTGVGSYAINGSTAGLGVNNNNYTFVASNGTLTIDKAHLTVTADGGKSMVYGSSALPTLTDTISGFVNGENATSAGVTGAAALSSDATAYNGTAHSGSNAGTYTIYAAASNLNAANYDFTYANAVGGLTVTKAQLAVAANNQTATVGAADPALTYSYTGLVNGDSTANFSGALDRAAGSVVGDYVIAQNTLAANGNYTLASYNPAVLSINAAPVVATSLLDQISVQLIQTAQIPIVVKPVVSNTSFSGPTGTFGLTPTVDMGSMISVSPSMSLSGAVSSSSGSTAGSSSSSSSSASSNSGLVSDSGSYSSDDRVM